MLKEKLKFINRIENFGFGSKRLTAPAGAYKDLKNAAEIDII